MRNSGAASTSGLSYFRDEAEEAGVPGESILWTKVQSYRASRSFMP